MEPATFYSIDCDDALIILAVESNVCLKLIFSSRMIEIQVQLSQRAIELLNLPEDKPCFLLDIG